MDNMLTQEHVEKGLSVMIRMDETVLLDPKGYPICRFLGYNDVDRIRKAADLYLKNIDIQY